MTAKRKLKRRVRERQARTGESYMTARRHVVSEPGAAPPIGVPVVQLHDATAEAARMGFRCRIAMDPSLCERVEPAAVLAGLRDTLVGGGELGGAALFARAFDIPSDPPPGARRLRPVIALATASYEVEHVRLWLGRGGSNAPMLVFRVVAPGGTMAVLCVAMGRALALMAVADKRVIDLSYAG